MNPKTAHQINDPQTGQVSRSRHSALSELMIQNAELRADLEAWHTQFGMQLSHASEAWRALWSDNDKLKEQLRVLQSAYDSLSKMKERGVAKRIEMDELRGENEELKKEYPRCEVCNSELSYTGPLGVGGCPTLDCKVCNLREDKSRLEADNARMEAALARIGKAPFPAEVNPRSAWNEVAGFAMSEAQQSDAFKHLLAPTIGLLEAVIRDDPHCSTRKIESELARLRRLVEGNP